MSVVRLLLGALLMLFTTAAKTTLPVPGNTFRVDRATFGVS